MEFNQNVFFVEWFDLNDGLYKPIHIVRPSFSFGEIENELAEDKKAYLNRHCPGWRIGNVRVERHIDGVPTTPD